MITVGSILGGTFRFARANIRAILIWSLLSLVMGVATRLLMGPFYRAQAEAMTAVSQGLVPTPPPVGGVLLGFVVMLLFLVVLYNAVFRAALFPEESAAAYLRVGMDELRLIGLLLILAVAFFGVTLLLGLVLGVLGALLMSGSGSAMAGAGLIAFLLVAILWLAWVWISVRLSVAAPLTLYRKRIVIGPAWRLTRGRFWTLFGAHLVVILAVMVVTLILVLPQLGPMMAAMRHAGDPDAARELAELQAQQMEFSLTPLGIVWLIVSAAAGGVMLAIFGGLPAVATAQLLNEHAEPA